MLGENIVKNERLKEISMNLCSDKQNYMRSFRKNVDMYVSEKDITLREISEVADMSFDTLKNFLYKDSVDCKLSTAIKLARALQVSVDELVGAETIPRLTMESIQMCRNLPDNDVFLIRWFIRYLDKLNNDTEPNKRYISVMELECNGNGNLKITSNYRKEDITELDSEVKGKVFFGITMPCDHYMPHYSPYDILLIANDRPPKMNENCLIRVNGLLHIAKRKCECDVAKYYSIRDGKFRLNETEIDELIGYIAHAMTFPTNPSELF